MGENEMGEKSGRKYREEKRRGRESGRDTGRGRGRGGIRGVSVRVFAVHSHDITVLEISHLIV